MISSLEVGSVFRLVDEATPILLRITDALKALTGEAEAAKKALSSISSTAFAGLNTRLGTVTDSVKAIGGEATKAADTMAAGFDRVAAQVDLATASVSRMAKQMAAAAAEAKGISVPGGGGGGGGGRARLLGGGGGGGSSGSHITTPNVGGGFHLSGGGLGLAAGAWSLWESLKASADLQEVQDQRRVAGRDR